MRIKELAPQIFHPRHMYYEQILQAKTWSQVAALHIAQELSKGDTKWYIRNIEKSSGKTLLQSTRDNLAMLIRETR